MIFYLRLLLSVRVVSGSFNSSFSSLINLELPFFVINFIHGGPVRKIALFILLLQPRSPCYPWFSSFWTISDHHPSYNTNHCCKDQTYPLRIQIFYCRRSGLCIHPVEVNSKPPPWIPLLGRIGRFLVWGHFFPGLFSDFWKGFSTI